MIDKGKPEEAIGNIAVMFMGGMVLAGAIWSLAGRGRDEIGKSEKPARPAVGGGGGFSDADIEYLRGPYQEYEVESQEKAVRAAGLDQPRREAQQEQRDWNQEVYEEVKEEMQETVTEYPDVEERREDQRGIYNLDKPPVKEKSRITAVVPMSQTEREVEHQEVAPVAAGLDQPRREAQEVERFDSDRTEYERVIRVMQETNRAPVVDAEARRVIR